MPIAYVPEPPTTSNTAAETLSHSASSELLASATASSSAGNWHIECADCPKWIADMTDRSLQVDSKGQPHIAYGGDHLYYAWHDQTQWHYKTVDDSSSTGSHAALALDSLDRPHISYYGGGDLKYAWHDGTTWHVETVQSEGDVGEYTSLALDTSDRPHIGYYDDTNDDLKYAWFDGTRWHILTVDSEGGWDISLALDKSGDPHISYAGLPGLRYAWHDGVNWHTETVDSSHYRYTSLALDEWDRPHISYYEVVYEYYTKFNLKYARHDGSIWQIEKVPVASTEKSFENALVDAEHSRSCLPLPPTTPSPPNGISLALDNLGRPHIIFNDVDWDWYGPTPQYDIIGYVWHDGVSWQLDYPPGGGESRSIALDNQGQPHISYYNSTYGNLRHAIYDGTWAIQTVDEGSGLSMYDPTSLALDETGQPHITYRADPFLKYAWRDTASWHAETMFQEGTWLGGTSLALDGMNRPHISYSVHHFYFYFLTSQELKYAWLAGSSWQRESVDGSAETENAGWGSSLALDASDLPHISYGGDPGLRYARYDETRWYRETVCGQGGGYSLSETSLALDALDRPHIGYYDALNDTLIYAWHDGTRWYTETVDSGEGVGEYPSLALDVSDRPHISYYNSTDDDLIHAWRDGTRWYTETVDSGGDVGRYTSLALDVSGRPHISYFDYTNGNLKYAWKNDAIWQIEVVDHEGYVGAYSSVALDASGRPHISYYDTTNRDLKYAVRMPTISKQAFPANGLHNGDVLSYTLTAAGPASSVRLWDSLPRDVSYITGSITSTIAPPAVYSPTVGAIVWQGALPTSTVQTVRFQVIITGGTLLSPFPGIANTAWLTDTERNIGMSATVIVNARVFYLPFFLDRAALPPDRADAALAPAARGRLRRPDE